MRQGNGPLVARVRRVSLTGSTQHPLLVFTLWFFKRPSISQLQADPEGALKHRVVFLEGEIEAVGTNTMIAKLLYLNSQSQSPIHLLINSVGGDVVSGLAIVDTFS
jgi:ClpP protease-like protein